MELDYALLAERADRLHDQRLVVFGGDADQVEVAGFPAMAHLTLVARFWLFPNEPLENHVFAVEITMPSGERRLAGKSVLNTKRNESEPDQPSAASVLANLILKIAKPGVAIFHLLMDGREVKTMRVRVVVSEALAKEISDGMPKDKIDSQPLHKCD